MADHAITTDLVARLQSPSALEADAQAVSGASRSLHRTWNAEEYANEQIRSLVQQVFFPGWPKSSRQIVLCGADQYAATVTACARVACTMATILPGTVCAAEANLHSSMLEAALSEASAHSENYANGSVQIGNKLWFIPAQALADANGALSVITLRTRLGELWRKFDYSLIQAPPAQFFSETVLLGQLVDGVVLMLQARRTHRAVARRMQQILTAAKIPILGAVLMDRIFPIPEQLYDRL